MNLNSKKTNRPSRSTLHKWSDTSAFFYSSYVTPLHSHNTMQLVFDTQNEFRFRVVDGPWQAYRTLLIKENVIHQLDTNNSVQLIIYLDCESAIARQLKSTYLKEDVIFSPQWNLFHQVASNDLQLAFLKPGSLEMLVYQLINCLADNMDRNITDDRIIQLQQTISTGHPQEITQRSLAKSIFLSESRMRSLFKEVTGISLHQYYLINKIRFATNQILMGASVTDAALEAGFTDSSHFGKMTSKFFNISPSQLVAREPKKVQHECASPLKFKTTVYEGK